MSRHRFSNRHNGPRIQDPELPRKPCHKVIRDERHLAERCKAMGLVLYVVAGGKYKLLHEATGRCVECMGLWAAEHVLVGWEFAMAPDREPRPGMWRDDETQDHSESKGRE